MMKTIFLTAPLALALLFAPATHASGIAWQRDFQNITAATESEKPRLLRFFATWCGPCRVMDSRVWPDTAVVEAVNKHYTPVEIDIDAPGAAALAQRYNIIGVPTIILVDRDGKELARANFMSPEQTVDFLKKAAP